MVETSGSRHCQQPSPWESSSFQSCMIAPVELRQHESLPASLNPFKGSTNLGLNGLEFHGLPERGLLHETNGSIGQCWPHPQTPFLVPNGYLKGHTSLLSARADVQPSAYGLPSCPQEKRFLIFDQSGDETRVVFSSLCPRVQNLESAQAKCPTLNLQDAPATLFAANQFRGSGQPNKTEQVWTKTPVLREESDENETVDEGSGMQEDTDEINALLYSDNDDDCGSNCDEDEDDELSTGHSPLTAREEQEERDLDEVDSFDPSSKRQKTLDGAHNDLSLLILSTMSSENNIHGGDMTCALDKETVPTTIGKKRLRKEKIRDTLRALESIIPGAKNKNPLIVLDEAISYLKCLKHSAQVISLEDPIGEKA